MHPDIPSGTNKICPKTKIRVDRDARVNTCRNQARKEERETIALSACLEATVLPQVIQGRDLMECMGAMSQKGLNQGCSALTSLRRQTRPSFCKSRTFRSLLNQGLVHSRVWRRKQKCPSPGFLLLSAVLRVRGRFQNPRQTPVRTKVWLKRFPRHG